MATTTETRTKDRGKTEPETPAADEVRESFISRMAAKLRAAWRRSKAFGARTWGATKEKGKAGGRAVRSAARWTGRQLRRGGAAAWRFTRAVGFRTALAVTWTLSFIGRAAYEGARFVLMLVVDIVAALFTALCAVVWFVVGLVGWVLWGASQLVFLVIKLVQLVALVLCTPYIAMKSRQALREDWSLMMTGLKPRNWHIMDPTALAAQTMAERAAKAKQRARAASDGQGAARRTAGKGRATPRRAPRRATRIAPGAAAAAAQA